MRLSQYLNENGVKTVCATDNSGTSRVVENYDNIRSIALQSIELNAPIPKIVEDNLTDEEVDLATALAENRILVPIDHPDPVHTHVSGSGLSHKSWLEMAGDLPADESTWPDQLKTLVLGHRGGRVGKDTLGAQPEWFYKGTGDVLVAPGQPLEHPFYGVGLGEEAEIAGLYIIGPDQVPYCIGYTIGNESSDELMYFKNVYHLSHSKRRTVSLGPEVFVGDLPNDIRATVSIIRNGSVHWSQEFGTGEANMLHSISNIEAHYFKYRQWFKPGDIHVLYLGNALMSTEMGETIEDGDEFKIECDMFGLPLTNPVKFMEEFPILSARPLW